MQPQNLAMRRASKLELEWTAHYKDGTVLKQQYGQGDWDDEKESFTKERHFGHIDQDKLKTFELSGPQGSYILDLETGEMLMDGRKMRFKHLDIPSTDERMQFERRLIFFRRIRQDVGPEGVKITNRYLIGWQATLNNKNVQFIIIIEPDGSLTFMNKR